MTEDTALVAGGCGISVAPAYQRRGFAVSRLPSWYFSIALSSVVALGCMVVSTDYHHWFLIPLVICGSIIGADAFDWIRGKCGPFDPVGVIGLFGYHVFFVAPLLHVHWDYWLRFVIPPVDWRTWLGSMAVMNIMGLCCYRVASRLRLGKSLRGPRAVRWEFEPALLLPVLVTALAGTLVLQLWVYETYGGIVGYIRSYEESRDSFRGMGWLFMVSEAFPILAMLAYGEYARKRRIARGWVILAIILVVFFLLKMFFGGLRGSRANTIWAMMWAVGIIHYLVRPISRKLIMAGCLAAFGFLYVYGFYKGAGSGVVQLLEGETGRASLVESTRRGVRSVLLDDLGRSDIQAFVLFRQVDGSETQHALGRTYVGAMALIVPRVVWPDRPPTKTFEGTETLYGRGSFSEARYSTRQYGLAGETMLNYGPLAIPVVFFAFGLVVRRLRAFQRSLLPEDTRWYIVPFLVYLCLAVLLLDSDNLVVTIVKNGLLPWLVIVSASRRRQRRYSSLYAAEYASREGC